MKLCGGHMREGGARSEVLYVCPASRDEIPVLLLARGQSCGGFVVADVDAADLGHRFLLECRSRCHAGNCVPRMVAPAADAVWLWTTRK